MPDALYIHRSALATLPPELRRECEAAARICPVPLEPTVFKISRRLKRVTLLSYPAFEVDAHPSLAAYAVVENGCVTNLVDCSSRKNPPILHRKELFVASNHPQFLSFQQLTQVEELQGLYQYPARIGTRNGWADALKRAGVEIVGHELHTTVRKPGLQGRGLDG